METSGIRRLAAGLLASIGLGGAFIAPLPSPASRSKWTHRVRSSLRGTFGVPGAYGGEPARMRRTPFRVCQCSGCAKAARRGGRQAREGG